MRGVTLMELLIVIVVIGILASIAVPSYRQYMMRAQRVDATAALLRVAAAQEKYYLQNNRYADNALLSANQPGGLGITGTAKGFYSLTVANPTDPTVDFVVTATTVSSGPQGNDTNCATFTIDQSGAKTATNSSAADNTDKCWR